MRWMIVVVGMGLALTGCQSGPTPEEEQAIQQGHDRQCTSMGARRGTDAYVNCRVTMMQIQATEEASETARRRAVYNSIAGSLDNFSRQQAAIASQPISQPVRCTSRPMGAGTVSTTCY